MKKIFPFKKLCLVFASWVVLTSCNEKKIAVNTTTKQHMEAETKTIENIQSAYQLEKTATAKYKAYSTIAEAEGYHHIALLYDAVAASENIHAINHRAVIEDAGATVSLNTPSYKSKTTKENLYDDIHEEAYDAKTRYPDFLETCEIAGNEIAFLSLTYAMKSEQKHKFFFQQALGDINSNTLNSLPTSYFVCPACGNTYTNPPKHCDFSLTDSDKFLVFQ